MMHHCGMWAMIIPRGRITWNLGIVALSYIVAFVVCLVASTTMEHMEVHLARQVAFSTFAALGVCCMHYMGMAAATFHTYSPPAAPGQSGYPTYLPVMIVGIALSVCIMSNMALSHSSIIARNKMAEMVQTKRRLWRIMAEKEAAEQANERKQQFISVASHEIRTPLHTINGYCELMAKTSLTEEQAFFVSSIQQAYHAINVIAGNVLDFSQLDSNKAEPSAKPALMKLRKVIGDAVRIQPNQHGVELVVSVTDDVPHTVLLDEAYIFRVLMNLLSNAQKFCKKGYISVVVRLGKPGQIVFQVRDTGVGIPTSFRGALFQPFRQADQSLTRPKQGTGLGLSIVKNLVSRMNGTVDVESVEGEGSTFNIRLPIAITDHAPSAIQDPLLDFSSKQPPPRTTGKRMRIIHSNPLVESLLVQLFSDHGGRWSYIRCEMRWKPRNRVWAHTSCSRRYN
ncbi:histidine kinase-like ATPase [Fomitopsis betulina]|nr:histidine kinase-like ATPase [Fomitopsis betulina]